MLRLAEISPTDASFVEQVRALGVQHEILDEGLERAAAIMTAADEHAPGLLVADLKIARGLDYYTGTVYETQLVGHESYGSICSGGRYDSLASDGKTTYPGVGHLHRCLPAAAGCSARGCKEHPQHADRSTGCLEQRRRAR